MHRSIETNENENNNFYRNTYLRERLYNDMRKNKN